MTITAAELRQITVTVNGQARTALVEPRLTLGDFLRDELNLKSVHYGCQYGVCGACTVLVGGESLRACLMFAVEADGLEVETVEGLSSDPRALHPIQEAFTENYGLQCGFCTPAMVMRTKEILDAGSGQLTGQEIRHELSGIVCRCTGYQQIVDSVLAAQQAHGAELKPSVMPSGPTVTGDDPIALVDTDGVGERAYDEKTEN